jgi:hypothetical protein
MSSVTFANGVKVNFGELTTSSQHRQHRGPGKQRSATGVSAAGDDTGRFHRGAEEFQGA